jgi:hypothetical protein
MPTFESAQYALQKPTRTNTSRNAPANLVSSDIEFAIIPHVLTTEAAADIINLCVLPAGSIPVPELSKMVCMTDPGTAFTVKVGTAADDDGWATSIAATVAGPVDFMIASGTSPAWAITPTPLAADTNSGNAAVFATVVTATAITATTVINFVLAYKRGR